MTPVEPEPEPELEAGAPQLPIISAAATTKPHLSGELIALLNEPIVVRRCTDEAPAEPEQIDELAVARSLRRLDAIAEAHPELCAGGHSANVDAWIDTLTADEEARMPREPTTQVAFRLSDRLLARIDRHAKRMSREHRGVEFTRADAVRDLLERALVTVE